ncbi:MAG: OmpA family protein [Thainema sp.]
MAAQLPNLSPQPQPPNSKPPKSSKPPKPGSSRQPVSVAGRLRSFVSFWLRLLLLGVGSGAAWLLGVAIAQFYPAQNPEPPLQEIVMRQTSAVVNDITSLPQRWGQETSTTTINTDLSELPVSTDSTTQAEQTSPVPDSSATNLEPLNLDPQAQEQAEAELSAIRTELEGLQNRMAALETDVGQEESQAELAARIDQLSRRLNPETATTTEQRSEPVTPGAESPPSTTSPSTSREANDNNAIAPTPSTPTDPIDQDINAAIPASDTLKITLPSDVLFANETQLNQATRPILDSIIRDLQNYPGATIHVSGHTDNQIEAATRKTVSFQQAKAVQSYLAERLGDQYRWVTVGYGSLRSQVPNDSDLNRQRNRRIEVTIYPR